LALASLVAAPAATLVADHEQSIQLFADGGSNGSKPGGG
jgi:hypothetical protein